VAKKKPPAAKKPPDPFADLYPNVAGWLPDGIVEIGRDDMQQSFIRVLNYGNLIWEGDEFPTVHAALQAADRAIAAWVAENG
jgi:hypothetical protein